ncbi:MAG: response regulator, partial [Alphaproteobacteria bacterium]|nr:response regulator [Alphaproteobacteria bacterium]
KQENIRENEEIKTRGVVVWDIPNDAVLRQNLSLLTDKLEHMFNTIPMGIVLTDQKLQIMEINGYAGELLERKNNDLNGQKLSAYFNRDDIKKIIGFLGDEGENVLGFDTTFKNEVSERSVRVSLSKLKKHLNFDSVDSEYILFYMQDTTNRRSLEMQVAQAQKMQAFGQMAGGVAHDFNNLLTAIVGLCDMLLRRHGIGDPSFADLIELKNNVTRAIEIARQLLTVSRKQPLNPKLIEVTEAFTDNEHLVSRILGEKIKLQVNYGSDLGYIRVDTVQLSQVLLNLAINAKDAMNGEGILTLAARVEHISEPYQFGGDVIQPGDFAVLSVKDTGCGIPEENRERIFEPFFSTKKNVLNSGTGLGLSMVYGIVRQMEGFIKVLSEVGKGTTFEIYLPSRDKTENNEILEAPKEKVILDKSGKVAMTTMVAGKKLISGEKVVLGLNIAEFDSQRSVSRNPGEVKILFVDDEDAVRIVGARGLRQKGYEVVDCISAENALEHIDNGEKFDMMITDMMMPGMSGAELANIMKEKNPHTVIILASGYSEEIARKELAGSQDFYFISKPYGLDDLNKKIKEVLVKV